MVKKLLLGVLLFIFTGSVSHSQTISFELSAAAFDGVKEGSIAFADVDGNGSKDVLITGQNTGVTRIAKLYINNGSGSFTLSGNTFEGVKNSAIAFADIDGDADQDVLITGHNGTIPTAKLYRNNAGVFTLDTGSAFESVFNSSVAFADVDGINGIDVLITGYNNANQPKANLYKNNGSGLFTVVAGTPFTGVLYSSVVFADVDGDGDKDVLIAGNEKPTNPQIASTKLYRNNGAGVFTLVAGTPFDGIQSGSIAFANIDGDTDLDVLITGYHLSSIQPISKLYSNDGTGAFSLVAGTPFEAVQNSSVAFADVDNDGDQDVLITGYNNSFQTTTNLYRNDGVGVFSLVTSNSFEKVQASSIAFADVDGNLKTDVLITGDNGAFTNIAKLYLNTTPTLALDDFDMASFSYFPNPIVDRLMITYSKEISEIVVYNLLGKEVKKMQPKADKVELDMSQLPPAIYMIKLTVANTTKLVKVIKQ